MKKLGRALGMIAVILLPSCCVFNVAKRPTQKMSLADKLEQKTVALVHHVVKDEDGDMIPAKPTTPGATLIPYCTGTWLTKDTFLTAGHCVEELGKPFDQAVLEHMIPRSNWKAVGIEDWSPVGQSTLYSARGDVRDTETGLFTSTHVGIVLAYDGDHDLALVQAAKNSTVPEHDVATVAKSARIGEEVHIVGHTVGLWWSYTHGYVAQIRPQMSNVSEHKMNTLQVSAPVYFGNSGGGAFNNDGELVGVMSWIRKGPNLGFFVRYDEVERLLSHERISH